MSEIRNYYNSGELFSLGVMLTLPEYTYKSSKRVEKGEAAAVIEPKLPQGVPVRTSLGAGGWGIKEK